MNLFLSYSKFDRIFADLVDKRLSSHELVIIRDEKHLLIGQNIKQYMISARESDYVIMLVSDNYLKSKACMFEILEILKEKDHVNKFRPIILDKSILVEGSSVKYVEYWVDRLEKLTQRNKSVAARLILAEIEEEKLLARIIESVSDFIDILRYHFFHTLEDINKKHTSPLDVLIQSCVSEWNKKDLNASVGNSYRITTFSFNSNYEFPDVIWIYTSSGAVSKYVDDLCKKHYDSGWGSVGTEFGEFFKIPYSIGREPNEDIHIGKEIKKGDIVAWGAGFYGIYEIESNINGLISDIFISDGDYFLQDEEKRMFNVLQLG